MATKGQLLFDEIQNPSIAKKIQFRKKQWLYQGIGAIVLCSISTIIILSIRSSPSLFPFKIIVIILSSIGIALWALASINLSIHYTNFRIYERGLVFPHPTMYAQESYFSFNDVECIDFYNGSRIVVHFIRDRPILKTIEVTDIENFDNLANLLYDLHHRGIVRVNIKS